MQLGPCVFVSVGGEVGTRCLQTTVNCQPPFPFLNFPFPRRQFQIGLDLLACGSTAVIDHLCKETFFRHLATSDDCGVDDLNESKWVFVATRQVSANQRSSKVFTKEGKSSCSLHRISKRS
jgi:hypothetical protein